MKKFSKVLIVAILASASINSAAFADTDPFPGVASGGEIPGTRVAGQPGITCPAGSGVGIESNRMPRHMKNFLIA